MHPEGAAEDEKVASLITYICHMNDELNIPHCIKIKCCYCDTEVDF